MIVSKVHFSGLTLTPDDVADRWYKGVIPTNWKRFRFPMPLVDSPVNKANRWLFNNIEGRWALTITFKIHDASAMMVAFEFDHDAVTFALADGKIEMFKL